MLNQNIIPPAEPPRGEFTVPLHQSLLPFPVFYHHTVPGMGSRSRPGQRISVHDKIIEENVRSRESRLISDDQTDFPRSQ